MNIRKPSSLQIQKSRNTLAFLHGEQETHNTNVTLAGLAGKGNVFSSTSGGKKAAHGLFQRCCKGDYEKQTCVCHSAVWHF